MSQWYLPSFLLVPFTQVTFWKKMYFQEQFLQSTNCSEIMYSNCLCTLQSMFFSTILFTRNKNILCLKDEYYSTFKTKNYTHNKPSRACFSRLCRKTSLRIDRQHVPKMSIFSLPLDKLFRLSSPDLRKAASTQAAIMTTSQSL